MRTSTRAPALITSRKLRKRMFPQERERDSERVRERDRDGQGERDTESQTRLFKTTEPVPPPFDASAFRFSILAILSKACSFCDITHELGELVQTVHPSPGFVGPKISSVVLGLRVRERNMLRGRKAKRQTKR